MSFVDSVKTFFGSNQSQPDEQEGINDDLYKAGMIRILNKDENVEVLRERHAEKYRSELRRGIATKGTPRASPDRLRELIKER